MRSRPAKVPYDLCRSRSRIRKLRLQRSLRLDVGFVFHAVGFEGDVRTCRHSMEQTKAASSNRRADAHTLCRICRFSNRGPPSDYILIGSNFQTETLPDFAY